MACDEPLPLETEESLEVPDEEEDCVDVEVDEDVDSADGTTAATTSAPARLATTRPPVTATTWR
ncbi:hypothetical protein Pa4123_01140 [Phytohabitans aurantiacus]|uniref:Uncharacterized protein n=1 Tax=Phytohabitans aurantiacus TaxID=3016789 RepID=A0ABQ5QM29_9ACTN|nr:hypothetical protein Pa4123_01140 [Phytohabitans aurantiacus]